MRNFSHLLVLFLALSVLAGCNNSPSGANLQTDRVRKETVPPKPNFCKADPQVGLKEGCILLQVEKLWFERGLWRAVVSGETVRYTIALRNEMSANGIMPLVGHQVSYDLSYPGEIKLIIGNFEATNMPNFAGIGTILKVEAKK